MNFLGMGPMELFIVLLVAFIFLGPDRMVTTARKLGKTMNEVRRMAAEMTEMTDLDLTEDEPPEPTPPYRESRPGSEPSEQGPGTLSAASGVDQSQEGHGPVSFHAAGSTMGEEDPETPVEQDRS